MKFALCVARNELMCRRDFSLWRLQWKKGIILASESEKEKGEAVDGRTSGWLDRWTGASPKGMKRGNERERNALGIRKEREMLAYNACLPVACRPLCDDAEQPHAVRKCAKVGLSSRLLFPHLFSLSANNAQFSEGVSKPAALK